MKPIKPSQVDLSKTQMLDLLRKANRHLNAVLTEEHMRDDISMEVEAEVNGAMTSLEAAIQLLEPTSVESPSSASKQNEGKVLTAQQGQFLAFICEYKRHNYTGLAPSHADLQRYFRLTPPSVNSMLIRLE